MLLTVNVSSGGIYNTGQEGVVAFTLHDSFPMKNNKNFCFPSRETGGVASMSSRSKTGAKIDAVDYN